MPQGCQLLHAGAKLKRPRNASRMTMEMHALFGQLRFYLEPVGGAPGTRTLPRRRRRLSLTTFGRRRSAICFVVCPDGIERPSLELLANPPDASAGCRMRAARRVSIDQVLRERDEGLVRADGTTNLGTPHCFWLEQAFCLRFNLMRPYVQSPQPPEAECRRFLPPVKKKCRAHCVLVWLRLQHGF